MISFEVAKTSELSAVLEMMESFYAIDNYPFDAKVSEKLYTEFISNEHLGRCWIIVENEKAVGYMILTFIFSFENKGKIAFLDELYIKAEHRKTGIGKKAIQFVQEQAKILSLKLLYLEVEPHNEQAQNLYLSQYFEHHNRKLMKFKI